MDEDSNSPERFRLPKSFGESDDPVEGNPFPTEDRAHQVWSDATREAQAEILPHQRRRVDDPDTRERRRWAPTLTALKVNWILVPCFQVLRPGEQLQVKWRPQRDS